MNEKNKQQPEHYEQIGVAMTCRSYAEYMLMFDLNDGRLRNGPILDVAAGASSFAAEAASRGYDVTAADPRYQLTPDRIRDKGLREIQESTNKLEAIQHQFDWTYYGSIQEHQARREQAIRLFDAHYSGMRPLAAANEGDNRYIPALLPNLPFEKESFSLVLCSHFLFLYQEQFDAAFHEAALLELMRVCRPDGEARVYPLLSLRWNSYPFLDELMEILKLRGIACTLEPSRLPFIPGSTHMLVMRHEDRG